MALPVKSCTDEELEDYASIHPEAAQELADRLANTRGLRVSREKELEEEARDAERAAKDAEDSLQALKDICEECIKLIRKALDEGGREDRENQIRMAADKLEYALAVFGMTRSAALEEAKKKTPSQRDDKDAPGGKRQLTMAEWLAACEAAADQIMAGRKVRQLSVLLDSPDFAQQFIDLARRTDKCRDMRIKARCVLTDAQNKPILDKKTNAPRYGFTEWQPEGARVA